MMSEEMNRLMADIEADAELKKKIEEEARLVAEGGEVSSDLEAMAKAAEKLGYAIKVADLERAMAANEKLDREELHLVSGGKHHWCTINDTCLLTFMHHDEEDRHDNCLKDYQCVFVFHHSDP